MKAPTILTRAQARDELRTLIIPLRDSQPPDDRCCFVDHDWFVEVFLPAWKAYLVKRFGVNGVYIPNQRDCDKIARMFMQFLHDALSESGVRTEAGLLVARFYCYLQEDFGGIIADPQVFLTHALCLLRTTRGWLAVEEQSSVWAPWEEFPNRYRVISDTVEF